MTDQEEDDRPLSPEESIRLIERERAVALRRIAPNPLVLYLPWGVVWLVGYGTFFLRYGPAGDPLVAAMPGYVPGVVLGTLVVLAIGITVGSGVRASRGVKGVSDERGLYYGLAWFLAFALMGVVGGRLSDQLAGPEATLYWTATSTSIVAVLYLAGAAIWHDRSMVVLGAWVGVVNIVGVVAGPGWHSLVVAVGAGGGLIAMGVFLYARGRPR